MAKKHAQGEGNKAVCGIVPTNGFHPMEKVTCRGCNPKADPGREKRKSDGKPDWSRKCDVCGQRPVVPETGMCGPCTFGEADTAGGNW